jgi:hypothetical protein
VVSIFLKIWFFRSFFLQKEKMEKVLIITAFGLCCFGLYKKFQEKKNDEEALLKKISETKMTDERFEILQKIKKK